MSDREYLELAAKAAGIRLEWDGPPDKWQPMYYQGKTYHSFDPLTDSGQALELAVKLSLHISVFVDAIGVGTPGAGYDELKYEGDPLAATRRAIVRAAAEIGKAMV
jgi:hypothetical protein